MACSCACSRSLYQYLALFILSAMVNNTLRKYKPRGDVFYAVLSCHLSGRQKNSSCSCHPPMGYAARTTLVYVFWLNYDMVFNIIWTATGTLKKKRSNIIIISSYDMRGCSQAKLNNYRHLFVYIDSLKINSFWAEEEHMKQFTSALSGEKRKWLVAAISQMNMLLISFSFALKYGSEKRTNIWFMCNITNVNGYVFSSSSVSAALLSCVFRWKAWRPSCYSRIDRWHASQNRVDSLFI